MAIQGFKDIIDRRGYKVELEDRKVFEKEMSKSNFGLGCSDMIEFILYDVSENKLPQGDDGKLVRYISINDANIDEYFILSDNPNTKKKNETPEFIVDIEKLIREAGYDNGIFKTQVTLLNRRVGTEGSGDDSLWIHEISPSRTEIRILPNRAKGKNLDLEQRYSIFTDGRNFRDDIIYYVNIYIENLDLQKILDNFLFTKGTESDGVTYINLIKKEFNIPSFEVLLDRIKRKFIESMKFYVRGAEWDINNVNFGKAKNDVDCVELSIQQIQTDAQQSLINCIEFYLPKRNIQKDNLLTKEQQVTLDKVKQILKTSTSNSLFQSTVPDKIEGVVRGCNDPDAENFNPLAKENDGSCRYKEPEVEIVIKGCTRSDALNYNPKATQDDGSCKYKNEPDCVTKKYYVWSATASIKYKLKGVAGIKNGVEYDSFSIKHDTGTMKFVGDVREVPKPVTQIQETCRYVLHNVNFKPNYRPFAFEQGVRSFYGAGSGVGDIFGQGIIGNRPNPYFSENSPPVSVTYMDALGNRKTSKMLSPGDTTTICARVGSVTPTPGIEISKGAVCTGAVKPTPPPVVRVEPPRQIPIPVIRGGSGGGGGGFIGQREEFEIAEETINPFTNPGDRVNRNVFTRNYL